MCYKNICKYTLRSCKVPQMYIYCWKAGGGGQGRGVGCGGPWAKSQAAHILQVLAGGEEIMKETGRRLRGQMSGVGE